MAEIIRTVSLSATFAKLQKGETLEIGFGDATESNVRTAASRFSKENNIELKVSTPRGAGTIKVIRIS